MEFSTVRVGSPPVSTVRFLPDEKVMLYLNIFFFFLFIRRTCFLLMVPLYHGGLTFASPIRTFGTHFHVTFVTQRGCERMLHHDIPTRYGHRPIGPKSTQDGGIYQFCMFPFSFLSLYTHYTTGVWHCDLRHMRGHLFLQQKKKGGYPPSLSLSSLSSSMVSKHLNQTSKGIFSILWSLRQSRTHELATTVGTQIDTCYRLDELFTTIGSPSWGE